MKISKALTWFFKSEGWGIFFVKFAIFSILGLLIWNMINIPYGRFICERTLAYERSRDLPILDTRFTDEKGLTLNLLLAAATHAPVPLRDPRNVDFRIFPNTLHFNIIPFIGLILATPVTTVKRLVLFLIGGFLCLSITHFFHLHLDIAAYYYKQQDFVLDKQRMAPERLREANAYMYRMNLIEKLQGFMEQAGSMLAPAFIWMIYSQKWLFRNLLRRAEQKRRSQQPSPGVSSTE